MNHRRVSRLSIIFLLAMVVLLAGTVPAGAQAERIYYTGEDCPITIVPGRLWVSDGVLHERGFQMINIQTYDPAFLSGMAYLVANRDVNLATGAVHVYGTAELHPNGADGTFVGIFSTHVSPEGVVEGNAVVHGTGEFEGMISHNSVSSPDAFDPACNYMNTFSDGYIIVPHE